MSEDITALPSTVGIAQATEYRGNTNDLIALTAAVTGLSLCGYMATNGLICCLPVILGAAGLFMAKDATDPKRARTLSIIGLASMGLFILFILCLILFFVGMMILAGLGGPQTFQ